MPTKKDKTTINTNFLDSVEETAADIIENEAVKKPTKKAASSNRKAKRTNLTLQSQSQYKSTRSKRKQILITPEMNHQLDLVARYDGVSQNELINEAVAAYLKSKMKDKDLKEFISKRS